MGTPFPRLPMAAIGVGLVANAYALSSLFPYVGYMVQHLGATDDKDEAGFYAGYLFSAFMIGRCGSSHFWGRFGDRYGRLPVIYLGLCSIAFLSVAFGLSTTFSWAVTCRFLLGAMNGLLGVSKTMISEVCGREHDMIGMSFITGCWSIGFFLGPGLAGLLVEPANYYPSVFSESGLFGRFPYLLPNIFGAGLAVISLPLVHVLFKETLQTNKRGDRRGFKHLQASETELHNPEAAFDKETGVKTIDLDNRYDLELANDNRPRSHFASNRGGVCPAEGGRATTGCADKSGCEAVGSGTCNVSSAQVRAEERLAFAGRSSTSYNGASDLEGKELLSMIHDGARGSVWSGKSCIRQDRNFDDGGCKSREQGKRRESTCSREFRLRFNLLGAKRVRTVLFGYALFSGLEFGFNEAYPLWAISSVGRGGLDWTTQDVGQALSECGGVILIFQLFIYPRVVKRVSARTLQRAACCVATPVLFAYPFLARLHDSGTALVTASLVLLVLFSTTTTAMVVNFALATNNSVDSSQRNTVNGLSVMVGSLAKAAGPTAASTTFAWSIQHRHPFPFDQHLISCLLALGMVVVAVVSWNIDISPVKQKLKGAAAAVPVVMTEEALEQNEESV